MRLVLRGARIFDGESFHDGHAVVIDGGYVEALPPTAELSSDVPQITIEGLLAPGFIDVQVNGGGGVLFNTDRTMEGIARIGATHRRFGTIGFLPTFISDTADHMAEAAAAVVRARRAGVPGLLGVHFEGPFLNPSRRGAHDARSLRTPGASDVRLLTGLAAELPVLLTVAPEQVPENVLAELAAGGVILSAGHTEADYETARAVCRNGVRGFTHLFNAMPPLSARSPGAAGAALETADAWCGIIADLHHVAAPMLRIAFAAKGVERLILVSDAMPTVGSDIQSFELGGARITRSGGRLTTPEGTLAGADLDMATAVRNVVKVLGLPLEAALRMASRTPAAFLRLEAEYGRIAPGYRASFVLLDTALRVRSTWIDGALESRPEPSAPP